MGHRIKLTAVVAMLCAAVAALTPSTALASTAAVTGCQDGATPLVYLYYSSNGEEILPWAKDCSGDYGLNSRGYSIHAGAWSGHYWADGAKIQFCNGQSFPLYYARITRIMISATKIC